MSFWTSRDFEPARKNRFRIGYVSISQQSEEEATPVPEKETGPYWWWALSATLPSFEINEETYQMVNRKFKYPGMLTWNDINIVLYEDGRQAKRVLDLLRAAGYDCPDGTTCGSGISKGGFSKAAELFIEEIDPDGRTLQKFTLQNWFLKAASFGEATMDDDGFLTVSMTLGYDCIKYETLTTQP